MTKHPFLYLESTRISTQGLDMNPSTGLKPLLTVTLASERWQKRTADPQFVLRIHRLINAAHHMHHV